MEKRDNAFEAKFSKNDGFDEPKLGESMDSMMSDLVRGILGQIEAEILKKVPNMTKEGLRLFMNELKKKKQWNLALKSISGDISPKIMSLLKELANEETIESLFGDLLKALSKEADFGSFLDSLTPNCQEERSSQVKTSLNRIQKLIVERVPGLDEGSLNTLMTTLEDKKDWDQAVASIAQDVPHRKLDPLKALSKEADFGSLLDNLKPNSQEERSSQVKTSLNRIQKLIVERVPGLDEGSLNTLMTTLEDKKDWDQAVASIAQDVPPKKLDLLKALSKEADFGSLLDNLKPNSQEERSPQVKTSLNRIQKLIVERVPGLDEGSLNTLMTTLEDKKDWDQAVASIAQDVPPKKLDLLKALSKEADFGSLLDNLKPNSQEERSSQVKTCLNRIQKLIVERVPGLDEGSLNTLLTTLEYKNDWDQAVASIAQDVPPKKLDLLKALSKEADFGSLLGNLKPNSQEERSSQVKTSLNRIQKLIVERVPGLDEGSLNTLMTTLEDKKDWDQAVASIAQDVPPKKLDLLKALSKEADFGSLLDNLKPNSQEERSSQVKTCLNRIQKLIVERVPGLDEGSLNTLMTTLEDKKDWDQAVASIAQDVPPKKLDLLKALSKEADFGSLLDNLKPNSQEERSSQVKTSLNRIQKLIVERVPGLDEGSLNTLMTTLEDKKDWDQAVASIAQDVPPKKLDLLKALSKEADFGSLLDNLKPNSQEERSSQVKTSLNRIQKLIVERVPGLDEGSLNTLMTTLEDKKDWDQAVASIAQDVPPKKLDLLKALSKETSFLTFFENVIKVQEKIEKPANYIEEIKIEEKNEKEDNHLSANRKKTMLIQELYENYKGMPPCFEKSLILLISYASMLIPELNFPQKLKVDLDKAINDEFELLKISAKKEERESDDIIKALEEVETFKIQKDWKSLSKVLEAILQKIRPLDIRSMMNLIAKVDEAAKSIKNRDVFLLLGKTGVGKSTLVHFLAGSKMGFQKIETFRHIGPIGEIQNPDLKSVIASPYTNSETRYISPVRISFRGKDIILCDSPGFEDTSGPEVDIANCLGIVKAIRGCKTVKPIILLSNKSGDRFQAVKDIAHILVGMIPSIEEHLCSFSYVFTKFPSEELQAIPSILKNLISNFKPEESADKSFTTFMYDMESKVRKFGPTAIDVINDDRESIIQGFLSTASISYPEEVFKVSISPLSKSAVQEQALKHQITILSAAKRANFELVKYKLDDLQEINKFLNQDSIQNIYEDCIRYLVKLVNQNYHDSVAYFNQRLTSKNALTEDDISKYKDFMKKADNAELVRDTHLKSETVCMAAYENKVRDEIETLCSEILSLSLDDILIIREIADKVKLLSSAFPSFGSNYQDLLKTMVVLVESSFQKFETATKSADFQASGHELHMLYLSQQSLSDYLSSDILKKFTLAQNLFINMLKETSSKFDELFDKDSFLEKDVTDISAAVKLLTIAKETYNLQPYIPLQTINDNYNSLIKKVESFVLKLISYVERKLKEDCKNTFENLEFDVSQIKLIRTVPAVDFKTSEPYFTILNKIFDSVKNIRLEIERALMLIFDKGETVNCKELNIYLTRLKTAKWIETYREGLYQDIFTDVQRQITQHLNHLQRNIQETSLDLLDNFSLIIPTAKKVSEALDMQHLVEALPDIQESLKEISQEFLNAIERVFSQIIEDYNPDKLPNDVSKIFIDPSKTEKVINYIENCKAVNILSNSNRNKAFNSLNNFLKASSALMQTEYERIISSLTIYEENNYDKELLAKVQTLSKLLHDVDEIYKDYRSKIYNPYFPNVMETWKRHLDDLMKEITEKLEECLRIKSPDINFWLRTAKFLGKIDEFVGSPDKFSDIFRDFSSKHFQDVNQIHGKLHEDLQSYRYMDASTELDSLKLKNDNLSNFYLQKAVQFFNASFQELIEDIDLKIIMLSQQLTLEELQIIQINLKKVENAATMMKNYLNTPEEVKMFQKKITSALSAKVLIYLDGLSALLTGLNFAEAETKLSHGRLIGQMLPKYLSEEVHKKISELTATQSDFVKKVTNEYIELKIEEYYDKQPRKILEKFEAVKEKNAIYADAQQQIKVGIRKKFEHCFDEEKKKFMQNQTHQLRKLEQALQFLPTELKDSFTSDIETYKADIIEKMKTNRAIFQEATASNPPKLDSLLKIYSENVNTDCNSIAHEVNNFILKEMNKCKSTIFENFQELKVEDNLIPALKDICSLNQYFGNVFQEVSSGYKEAKNKFSEFLTELFSSVLKPVTEVGNTAGITQEIVKRTEKRYDDIVKIMQSLKNANSFYREMVPSNLDEKYLSLSLKITETILEFKQKFDKGLQQMDTVMLKSSLVAMERWIDLSSKMRNNSANSSISVRGGLPDKKNLMDMKEELAVKFKNSKEEIVNLCKNLVIDPSNFIKMTADENYQKLNQKLSQVKLSLEFKDVELGINPEQLVRECLNSVENKVKEFSSKADELLEKILQNSGSRRGSRGFSVYFNHLCSISNNIQIESSLLSFIENMKLKIKQKVKCLQNECDHAIQNAQKFSDPLMALKLLSQNTEILKEEIDLKIDEILGDYKQRSKNDRNLAKLGSILNSDKTGLGQTLISDHKCFEGYTKAIFAEKTLKHGISHVLEELAGDNVNTSLLQKRYDVFLNEYETLFKTNLKPNIDLTALIGATKMVVGTVVQEKGSIKWDVSIRNRIPSLMAHIFAIWTLQNATYFFEAEGLENQNNYLLKPHAAQVISIFRLLGIGDDQENLSNNLVQIGTGEGKSITMAATACVLALCGFEVSCACYSQYLCKRDFEAFKDLFQSLDVLDSIHYGTFNKLCEDMVNRDGDIRKIISDLVSTDKWTENKSQRNKRPRILVIDEVDTFFTKEFYGNVYTPSVSLSDPTINELTDYIWNNRASKLKFSTVKKSNPYVNCCTRFKSWEFLIEEAVKDMLADVKTFESHDYVTKDDKIAYKDQTNLVFNVIYGYKTLFAYYKEHPKNISLKSLQENIKINIKCGSFSYGEIPKQFDYIMGVTGTLKTLSEPEKDIVNNVYNIRKKTYTPSVFGKNNLDPKITLRIEREKDYLNVIAQEIKTSIGSKKDKQRAVLVFFENEKELMEFYKSPACEHLKSGDNVQYITEGASSKEKDIFINSAAISGRINLLTRSFGRGTDFICNDQTVIDNGGIHVLQTFLSEELSEETQIKGRTARQGAKGSYSMVLLDTSLEKFLITLEDIDNFYRRGVFTIFKHFVLQTPQPATYDVLNERRNEWFQSTYESNAQYVRFAKKEHEKALEFTKSLFEQDKKAVQAFLKAKNKGAEANIQARTLCLMDATGSMSSLLQKAKNTVGIMFERATSILAQNGQVQECFELQFAVYRNYSNDSNTILEYSPWESKSENLRKFMDKIGPKGGMGNEAIEIGLWHANQELKNDSFQQIILIGDAPANMEAEVTQKRQRLGETYWRTTKFDVPTHYEKEVAELKNRGVRINAFYVDSCAKTNFEEIAAATNGRCQFLDINSNKGANMLTDLVTEEILKTVGTVMGAGDKFVLDYISKYGKSYA